jgi:hypothetical protein
MPLPSSGNQIALSQIRNEFGLGSGQIAMSQLYGKGNAPASSGAIQCGGHFHGVSAETILHSSTITVGQRVLKSTVTDKGYDIGNAGFVSGGFGSISTNAITGTSQIVQVVVDRNSTDSILGAFFRLHISGNFTGWTSIRINGSTTLNRSAATVGSTSNSVTYQWNGNKPTPTSFEIIQ